jgi:hypothetical protein
MSTQAKSKSILATPTREFDLRTFRKLLYSAKARKHLLPAKQYLASYFARGKVGVYKWCPKQQIFEYYNKRDAIDSFIQRDIVKFKDNEGNKIDEFCVQSWFFRDTPFFSLEVNPQQPLVYREPNGGYYINKFPGFLHPDPPPFLQFSREVRDQVKLILNHMEEVLCSSVEKQAYYMRNMVMRIAVGQKLQKTMFLYSGPGTGKTMLTWFLRMMVLGPKITHKTASEKVITGQFNKELEGKCLLVLEEMSNSKSADWITFANRLKDFVDSDTLTIEEKHRTPYPVTNITNLIISSNNSKTIRLDKIDRRYFIPDISEKYVDENGKGFDYYYAPLDEAIKNPEVGRAFYSYALEYVRLNPEFDERKIPMTKTKLMMTSRAFNPVHEFIKGEYLRDSNSVLSESSSRLYHIFKEWFGTNIDPKKKPPIIQEFSRAMGELGLKPKCKRVGDRKSNKKMQWYEASYGDLYAIFQKKHMIDDAENIEAPESYNANQEEGASPIEHFPAEESSSAEKNKEPKKVPPPIPPKPEHLKVAKEPPLPMNKPVEELIDDFTSELVASNPVKESVEPEEPYGIPGPSNTSAPEPIPTPEPEPIKPEPIPTPEPEPIEPEPEKHMLDQFYDEAEKWWAKCGQDPDDFDWQTLIEEVRNQGSIGFLARVTNKWEALLDQMLVRLERWLNEREGVDSFSESYRHITTDEVASILDKYRLKKELEIVPPPIGYRTVSSKQVKQSVLADEKEWARTNGEDFDSDEEDFPDDDEEFLSKAENIHNMKYKKTE